MATLVNLWKRFQAATPPQGRAIGLLLLIYGIPACLSAQTYIWKNVVVPAGGYVSGISYSPLSQNLIYMRTDMGGAYRWDNTNSLWIPLTDWILDWNLYGIESIVPDPKNANVVYAAIGQTYSGGNGYILSSTNQGNTWTQNSIAVPIGANNDGRNAGERLAVDPNLTSKLYFGSRSNGLWMSTNSAASWAQVGAFPTNGAAGYGLSWVIFGPGGTSGTASPTIFVGVMNLGSGNSNVYRSTNSGANWAIVGGGPVNMSTPHASLGTDGNLWIAFDGGGYGPNGITSGQVWRLNTGTLAWTNLTPAGGPPAGAGGYGGICVDAQNVQHVVVTTLDWWGANDKVFSTSNAGGAWTTIGNVSTGWNGGPFANYNNNGAPWTRFCGTNDGGAGWMGDIKIDPFNSNNAIYTTGGGIWSSPNINAGTQPAGVNWTFTDYGLEETAILDFTTSVAGGVLFSAMGDIAGMRHTNLAQSPAGGMYCAPFWSSSSGIDYAQLNTNMVVRAGNGTPYGAYSTNNGSSWTGFAGVPNGTNRNIAISANGTNILWGPSNAVASYSTNNGSNWTNSTGLPSGAFIGADRANNNIFYGISGTSLYVSTNGGASFSVAGTFAGALNWNHKPRAVFGLAGEVWVPTSTGLYRFTNVGLGAVTTVKIANVSSASAVGFGMHAAGQTHPSVYLVGTVGGQYGFFRCDDGVGTAWVRINDNLHQFGGPSFACGDELVYGRMYLGTNGRGILYGDISGAVATNTPTRTPTRTPTATPTNTIANTSTNTATRTATSTPTRTPTATFTNSVGNTATNSPSRTPTATLTNTPTRTPTNTPINTSTNTASRTPTASLTNTSTNTVGNTATNTFSATPSRTPTGTATRTPTATPTNTVVNTATNTPTRTPSNSPTLTTTNTATRTASATLTPSMTNTLPAATNTASNTPSNTASRTPSNSPTQTSTVSFTRTATSTPTVTVTNTLANTTTSTNTRTNTASSTPSNSPTRTPTASPTRTATNTSSATPSSTATRSSTPTVSSTFTNTFTGTAPPTNTATNSPSPTPSATSTWTGTNTPSVTPTRTPSNSPTVTPTRTPTNSPVNTSTSTVSNTATNTISIPTNTPTATRTASNTSSATPSSTATRTPSSSPTRTASNTPTNSPVNTNTSTATVSPTPTDTFTGTVPPTNTPSNTPSRTPSSTPTLSPVNTSTSTASNSPTLSFTRTATLTPTRTATSTATNSPVNTNTSTFTVTSTPTHTFTGTTPPTNTPSATFTNTFTSTFTNSFTPSSTFTSTFTPVATPPLMRLTPGLAQPGNSTQLPGTTNVPVLQIQWTNQSDAPTTLTSLTLTASGSGNDATGISSVSLYVDTNNNGLVDAGDTQLTTGIYTTNNGTLTLNFTDMIPAFAVQNLLVAYTFSGAATNGTYQGAIANNNSLTGLDGTFGQPVLFTGAPLNSVVVTIGTATSTPTNTPTKTFTAVNTNSFTNTFTATPTRTFTNTPVPTNSFTPTPTSTPTSSLPTPTWTPGKPIVIIYPNPAPGPTVDILPPPFNGPSDVTVKVFTTAFRKVLEAPFSQVPSGTTISISLNDKWGTPLASGLYYVVVNTNTGRSVGKLIVQR